MALSRIKQFFAPPRFEDDEKTRVAWAITILWSVLLIWLLVGLVLLIAFGRIERGFALLPLIITLPAIRFVMAQGRVRLAALLLTLGFWLLMILSTIDTGGIRAVGYSIGTVLSILIAGLLIGLWGTAGVIFANLLAGIVLIWGQTNGWIGPVPASDTPMNILMAHIFFSLLSAGLLYIATHSIQSALRRARQELAERRKTEATMRLMLRQMNAILWSTDTDMRFTSNDGAGLNQLNLMPNQLLGMPVAEYLETAEQAAPAISAVRRALQGESVTYEHLWRGITYQSYAEPLRNELEQIIGTVVLSLDISERKRMEEALRLSEERYRLLAAQLPQSAILLFDHDLRFALVDGPELERTGYSKAAMQGKTLNESVPAEFAQLVEPNMRAVLAGQRFTAELPFDQYFYNYTYMPINNSAGEVIYGMILAQNITERKKVEQEREQLIAELELRNAELERFTYTVSHDLKSPLVTIRGFLGFLERDAASGNFDRLRADTNRIMEATNKMWRLLDDLLQLSRIGRLVNPPQAVPFRAIVGEALELVSGSLNDKHISVSISDALPVVYGDRVRLVEVMQNLIENAARFMGTQPQPSIEIGVRQQQHEQVLYVRDNGIGIEPQHHQRIFGLFEKLNAQGDGTGIGLALVKRIIEGHGGRIWVESLGAGQGATLCFCLPLSTTADHVA